MDFKELHKRRVAMQAKLKEANEAAKDIKKDIAEVDKLLYEKLEDLGVDYLVTEGVRYERRSKRVFSIADFDQLWEWAKANDAPFVLQRRLSQRSVVDLVDSGEVPHGLEEVNLPDLRVVKS